MSEILQSIQVKVKSSSNNLFTFMVRLVSGGILGLVFALIGEEMLGYGTFSMTLVVTVVATTFLRIARAWSLSAVIVFDVVCVLIALLLRMYIQVAPGA